MTNTILWALLGLATITAMASVVTTAGGLDPDLQSALKAHLARRSSPVKRAGYAIAVCGVAATALWTWYAFEVGDWRFAALVWVPFVAGWIGRASR